VIAHNAIKNNVYLKRKWPEEIRTTQYTAKGRVSCSHEVGDANVVIVVEPSEILDSIVIHRQAEEILPMN